MDVFLENTNNLENSELFSVEKPTKNIFKTLLKSKFPEYDENKNYFHQGDIITLKDNQTVVVFISDGIQNKDAVVLKPGFFFKKEKFVKVNWKQLPEVTNNHEMINDFSKFITKKAIYKVGDIIQIPERENVLGLIIEVDKQSGVYVVYILKDDLLAKNMSEAELKFYETYGNTKIVIYDENLKYY